MLLPDKLKLLRYAHDYSIAYLAYKLQIDTKEYADIEDGKSLLTLKQAKVIIELYAIDVADFIEETEESYDWMNLLTERDLALVTSSPCEESIASLKAELASIKDTLSKVLEKLET